MRNVAKTAISLRRSLGLRVGMLVSGAVLLVGFGFFLFALEPMVERIAQSQFTVTAAQVEASLDKVFVPAEQVLAMSQGWLANEAPDLNSPEAFNRLFAPVLEALPKATSVVAGTSGGEGWMLLKQPDGSWYNRMTDLARWGGHHLFFERGADGKAQRYWKALDYDPRLRAWYLGAIEDKTKVQWTAPYTLFSTGEPGITASTHLALNDGRDLVVGLDLKLHDLSQTTMTTRVGKHGMALVLTDDLRVLALPAAPPGIDSAAWLGRVLQASSGLELAPLNDALAAWRSAGQGEVRRYRSGGEAWLTRIHSYRLGTRLLWVVSLAPEADFSPGWMALAGPLCAGLAVMLLLAAVFARQQAGLIARPLEALAAESERIGRLDFQGTPMAVSEIAEIGQLANAHEKMRTLLQLNQQQIAAQERELHDQIDALRGAEEKIRESDAYNKVLFSDSSIPLVVMAPESGRFVDCNQAAANIYRLKSRDAVLGLEPKDVSADCQYDGTPSEQASRSRVRSALENGAEVFEWRHRRPDGSEWDAELHLMPFRHGGRLLLQLSLQDITERKQSARVLENLALYDTLTGLPNRALFLDRLAQSVAGAQRQAQAVSVLFLDLDRFKEINDTQGHAVGDEVLREVARRFRAALRGEELLARLGGDEFAIVAANADRSAAVFIAERVLGTLRSPIVIGSNVFALGVSVGISLYSHDGLMPDTLLRNADIAMYRAKSSGQGYMFYDPEMSSVLAKRITLVRDLKKALAAPKGILSLHFQPQFNLSSLALVGAEALMRWDHPSLGPVSPALFIPLAEERGMMAMIGDWVLEEACRQLVIWRDAGCCLPGRLAINIAAQQIEDAAFPERTEQKVRAFGLRPEQFEFELTESGMMRNVELAIELFSQLNDAGFALAIDDFGTGYSSLSYLKRLPAEKLKIDKSFVRDMIDDGSDHAIVATIVGMGRTLGLRTIAEGVETQAQADTLLALRCDEAQGYLFGRPEPASIFAEKWLRPAAAAGDPGNQANQPVLALASHVAQP
jgi:diguanylate cyclase (GGDEF)-like protein/PAS domain S-box-containing protein